MRNKNSLFLFSLASIISFLLLYVIGSLDQAVTFSEQGNLKLMLLNIFLFVTLAFSIFLMIFSVKKDDHYRIMIKLISVLVGFVLAYKLITLPDNTGYAVGLSYIRVGDYLRDIHGISVYFMDWGGWAVTSILYLTAIFSSLTYITIKIISSKRLLSVLSLV